jgi:formylmethanofuran dehydrogenase subunit A
MKRYNYTWFNGMIEVPNGEYVKEKETRTYLQYWVNHTKIMEELKESQHRKYNELHTKYTDLRICSLLLTAGLMFSVFFNIFQFLLK